MELAAALNFPDEVSLSEAAKLLRVDKKTTIKYLRNGLLEWRDKAPMSKRPTYAIRLESIVKLRTAYQTTRVCVAVDPMPSRTRRHVVHDSYVNRHFKLKR